MLDLKVLSKEEVLQKIENDDIGDLACIGFNLETCWVGSNTVSRFLQKLNREENILFFTLNQID